MKTDYSYLKDLDYPPEEEVVLKPIKWTDYILATVITTTAISFLAFILINIATNNLKIFTPILILQFLVVVPVVIFLSIRFINRVLDKEHGKIFLTPKALKRNIQFFNVKRADSYAWEDMSNVFCSSTLFLGDIVTIELKNRNYVQLLIVHYPGLPPHELADLLNKWIKNINDKGIIQ